MPTPKHSLHTTSKRQYNDSISVPLVHEHAEVIRTTAHRVGMKPTEYCRNILRGLMPIQHARLDSEKAPAHA